MNEISSSHDPIRISEKNIETPCNKLQKIILTTPYNDRID